MLTRLPPSLEPAYARQMHVPYRFARQRPPRPASPPGSPLEPAAACGTARVTQIQTCPSPLTTPHSAPCLATYYLQVGSLFVFIAAVLFSLLSLRVGGEWPRVARECDFRSGVA